MESEYAIIVAGGKGTRMNSAVPKQFLELSGKPVLLRTLDVFYSYNPNIRIILVLPKDDFQTWQSITEKYPYDKPVILQAGGDSRFQSVKNGLQKIDSDGLVAIHDGVRPLISEAIIADSFRLASQHGSAVCAVALKESIRRIEHGRTQAVNRSEFKLIQTPQTFKVDLIKNAYSIPEDEALTDDASVAERAGHSIFLFEGSYENVKITTLEDLIFAEAILQRHQQTSS